MKCLFLKGLFVGSFLLFSFFPFSSYAKSYVYEDIDVDIFIQKDTTLRVEEMQTYRFEGEFHKGWRSVSLKDIDTLQDIVVLDAQTRQPLKFVAGSLEPMDPHSWGKYTYKKDFDSVNIEWYYNALDEKKSWIIAYTVVGGISFYKDFNEVYWNVFTDYQVLVERARVTLYLPEKVEKNRLLIQEYLEGGTSSFSQIIDEVSGEAESTYISPQGKFTVAFGFPRDIVERSSYWKEFFSLYIGYVLGILCIIGTGIFCFLYWFFGEKYKKGRGVIIAEYAPPENLPPAMGEVILKEKISTKTWAITIVDLAVRGFIRIREEKNDYWYLIGAVVIFGVFTLSLLYSFFGKNSEIFFYFVLFPFIVIIAIKIYRKEFFVKKDYSLERLPVDKERIKSLRSYEKKVLAILFRYNARVFSTKEVRKNISKAQSMALAFKKLQEDLYNEVTELGFYQGSLNEEKKMGMIFFFVFLFISSLFIFLGLIFHPWIFFVMCVISCYFLIFYFLKYEVKLNDEGNKEKEEWLGFREYLFRVERYRVENLTPETFSAFLPYAMMFGIEKKWAKNFETFLVSEPSWYTSSNHTTSFSVSGFSASLSSSFSSALSSSSGGGASGGGGSAGGGGGGGGGGAS